MFALSAMLILFLIKKKKNQFCLFLLVDYLDRDRNKADIFVYWWEFNIIKEITPKNTN